MKEHVRNPTSCEVCVDEKNKEYNEQQRINQIEGYTVTVRFSDTGLQLEHLIDAYIQEKLFASIY